MIKKIVESGERYNLYEGVDLMHQKFVSIYVKPVINFVISVIS